MRVAILSRQEVTSRGLAAMLSDYPGRVVVIPLRRGEGEFPGVDVVLYDTLCLHRRDGEELDQLAACESLKVLVYSRDMRPDLRARALARGCTAWVSMSANADALVEAIEQTAAGRAPAHQLLAHDRVLSPRETEILGLIAQGLSNHEITERLGLTANTLKTHVRRIYRKIGVTSRAQAVAWALQDGLLPSEPS